jgi:HD-GYP domain-containing protein (c-di-GMP phosphodiesterase class II)
MKYILLDNVEQGEKLGKPIFSSEGRVLLEEGAALSIGLIARLRRMGVNAIYLKDERFGDVDLEEVVSDTTKREAVEALANSMQFIQSGKKNFNIQGVSKTIAKVIDEILMNHNILVHLSDIRTNDNYLFVHSTNVCIMSVIVGIKLGLGKSELYELAMGALFHDIGKLLNPDSSRPEKDHTWLGFNFLRQKHDFSTVAAHVALQHHEQVDGNGYPRQMAGEKIHVFAKIVSVANFYDHLINPSDGSSGLDAHEACEKVLGFTNILFDHKVVWEFLRSIAFYPTGRQVKLSCGETGVIVGQNHGLPQRPIIRIFKRTEKSRFEDFDVREVDLAKETTVFIVQLL